MIRYKFSSAFRQHHLLDIEIVFDDIKPGSDFVLQLPAWRPGRYELGNFAKNIQKFEARDEHQTVLNFHKTTKDQWLVKTGKGKTLKVLYTYYAAELNAGSTYLDNTQLYVNPVNCCMYNPQRTNEVLAVELELPNDYKLACSMEKEDKHVMKAENFEELADSPFIASAGLQQLSFHVGELPVHIWLQGECKPNEEKIKEDFTDFMQWQLDVFGDCPCNEYHYLVQILPYTFYHGVEHKNSTVLALGPGYALNDGRYDELLGVSCHEFYHVWNIKTIRPAEMWPYDYTGENYFTTGFVAEGVTTYMGDYVLWQSGVFSDEQFFTELSRQVQKHLDNFGRFNHSVTQSGFDTWLDGYVPGVPDRKVSIYVEGCLLALMTDVLIMKNTKHAASLHTVMRELYNRFYLNGKGYTYNDYVELVSEIAGTDLSGFFTAYALKAVDYKEKLVECLDDLGMVLLEQLTGWLHESHLGFKMQETPEKTIITAIHPDSPAYHHALAINDQLIAVNGYAVKGDAARWINYFGLMPIELDLIRSGTLIKINIKADKKEYYKTYSVIKKSEMNKNQQKTFDCWKTKKQ